MNSIRFFRFTASVYCGTYWFKLVLLATLFLTDGVRGALLSVKTDRIQFPGFYRQREDGERPTPEPPERA